MSGDTYASMDSFDIVYAIRNDCTEMLGTHHGVFLISDSKELFDAVTCEKRTPARRFMVYMASKRQSNKTYQIQSIGLLRGDVNPANSLSKLGANDALWRIIESGG